MEDSPGVRLGKEESGRGNPCWEAGNGGFSSLAIPAQPLELKDKAPSGLASTKGAFRGFNQEPVHTQLLERAV